MGVLCGLAVYVALSGVTVLYDCHVRGLTFYAGILLLNGFCVDINCAVCVFCYWNDQMVRILSIGGAKRAVSRCDGDRVPFCCDMFEGEGSVYRRTFLLSAFSALPVFCAEC